MRMAEGMGLKSNLLCFFYLRSGTGNSYSRATAFESPVAAFIVENAYLNGETIRIDGELRMR